jgi:hypothetical protein
MLDTAARSRKNTETNASTLPIQASVTVRPRKRSRRESSTSVRSTTMAPSATKIIGARAAR